MRPDALFVVSRYNENIDWIKYYTDYYIVYNKGDPILDDVHVINTENIGNNQRDIFRFIYYNYEHLPRLTAFIQAYPFDHCRKEVFDKLIFNSYFTSLEEYEIMRENVACRKDINNGYVEYNNSWYIKEHNKSKAIKCKYRSFDKFMDKYFTNYERVMGIRFSPGSQYIVERNQILYYPKKFWESLMNELPRHGMTEGHIIERALFYIFTNKYKLRKKFYE